MVHGCMVYTELAETAAVSCGTSHASAVSTSLRLDIFKKALQKAIQSCRITCERSESARERRIALYKSDQHQQQLLLSSYRPPADKPRVLLQPVRTPHIHFGAKSPKSGHYAGPSRKIRTVEQQTDRLQTKPLK